LVETIRNSNADDSEETKMPVGDESSPAGGKRAVNLDLCGTDPSPLPTAPKPTTFWERLTEGKLDGKDNEWTGSEGKGRLLSKRAITEKERKVAMEEAMRDFHAPRTIRNQAKAKFNFAEFKSKTTKKGANKGTHEACGIEEGTFFGKDTGASTGSPDQGEVVSTPAVMEDEASQSRPQSAISRGSPNPEGDSRTEESPSSAAAPAAPASPASPIPTPSVDAVLPVSCLLKRLIVAMPVNPEEDPLLEQENVVDGIRGTEFQVTVEVCGGLYT